MAGVPTRIRSVSAPSKNCPAASQSDWDTLILGIGNVLWADEGFGVRCVEALHERYEFGPRICVMDGGTQGIFLLPWVRSARKLLLFDAIDFGLAPATLKLIVGDAVPSYMAAKKVSMHQAGFQEVLSSAQLAGDYPSRVALVGVQPVILNDYGGSLTPQVREQIDPAVQLGCKVLQDWGVDARKRTTLLTARERIGPGALDMRDYEDGRPRLDGALT